jgi:hypothetical protein
MSVSNGTPETHISRSKIEKPIIVFLRVTSNSYEPYVVVNFRLWVLARLNKSSFVMLLSDFARWITANGSYRPLDQWEEAGCLNSRRGGVFEIE